MIGFISSPLISYSSAIVLYEHPSPVQDNPLCIPLNPCEMLRYCFYWDLGFAQALHYRKKQAEQGG